MSFSSIKTDQTSEKYILIKIEPARYINDDLAIVSGTEYTMTFPFQLSRVLEQGVELTEVSSSPSAGQYSFNTTTKLLTVHLNAVISSTNSVIGFYDLFYTIEKFRVLGSNPEVPGTDLREWEPKIKSSPRIKQTIKNIIAGQLSISSSSLSIINDNGDFDQYTSNNDSFYNKRVQIWHVLDNISNIQKIFEGQITSLSVNRTVATLNIQDNIDRLTSKALMGDDEVYYTNANFTNIQPGKNNTVVRYYFGSVSRYDTISETVTNLTDAQRLDPKSMDEAVCTDYFGNIVISNNREWTIGRVGSNGTTDFNFSPSAVDNTDVNFTRLDTTALVTSKIHIGDTFTVTGSGTYHERVYYVDRVNFYVYITKNASIVSTDTINTNDCPSIVITDLQENYYYPLYGRDYTASLTTTSGGNKLIEINFVSNFEANHAGLSVLDPGVNKVYFKIKPDNSFQNHATILKELVDKSGMTSNAASFTAAASAFDVNACFSIPNFDEHNYKPYYKYCQDLLTSTLGYVYLNGDFEIVYKLFSTISATETITNIEIILGSYSYEINYKDIITSLIAFNPHYNSSEFVSVSSQTLESNKSRYLHGIINADRFRHVLENFTTKITGQVGIRSERDIEYTFKTKGINFDSDIGDEFLLIPSSLPGQATSRGVKILETLKGNTNTSIVATDLYNI